MATDWPTGVREPAYLLDAPRQTVSLTLNSDLYARLKGLGVNVSRIAEQALAEELERHRRKAIEAEIKADVEALNAYEAEHGSFAEHVRTWYAGRAPEAD